MGQNWAGYGTKLYTFHWIKALKWTLSLDQSHTCILLRPKPFTGLNGSMFVCPFIEPVTTAKPRTNLCFIYTSRKTESAWEKIKTSHSPPPKTNFQDPMQNFVTIVRSAQLKKKNIPNLEKIF